MEAYAPVAASPQGEPPNDANGPTLAAFERALRHESHNNHRRRPDLTWQQLRNGLQWGEEAVRERLEAEREPHRPRHRPLASDADPPSRVTAGSSRTGRGRRLVRAFAGSFGFSDVRQHLRTLLLRPVGPPVAAPVRPR